MVRVWALVPGFGGKVRVAMTNRDDSFPLDQLEESEKVRISVQLPRENHDDLEFVVEVWNQFNQVLGRKKGRPWSTMSVAQRLLVVAVNNFLKQYGMPVPKTEEERAEFMRRAVADVKKRAGEPSDEERDRRAESRHDRRKTPPR